MLYIQKFYQEETMKKPRGAGLTHLECDRLLEVTSAESKENPWSIRFVKKRNELLYLWIFDLGLSSGETLNAKVSDIDFETEEVTIGRRSFDSKDPRKTQPSVKKRKRILPMKSDLCHLTHNYVVNSRRKLLDAQKHNFLFVSDRTGAPLSLSALNKCFVVLRSQIATLPDYLSPRVLVHNWNGRLSARIDKMGISAVDEQKIRCYLMGWPDPSNSNCHNIKRNIRPRANDVLLEMQFKVTPDFKDDL